MAKQTKTEELLEKGYRKHPYPNRKSAITYKEAFEKKGRNAHYIRSGSKGNYQHNVLEK